MSQLDSVVGQARSSGTVTGPYAASSAMTYVDYRDVAEVAALAFTTDRLLNGTFELAAPGMFSRADVAVLLARLLGRPVSAEQSAQSLPESMPQAMRDGLTRMFDHYDRYGFRGGNALVLATLLGRDPVTVPEYLERAVAVST